MDDAAVAFLGCARQEDALRCYQHAGDWHMAFALAKRLGHSPPQLRKLALAIIEQLVLNGRSQDAGDVAATHLQVR